MSETPSPETHMQGPVAYIAPDIFERLKAGGSGMFPISNSKFKSSDLTVPLYAELHEIHSEETPEGGVVRLSKWPEGYVLWYHGEIVWRSWIRAPQELTLRLSLDTTLLEEALMHAQEHEATDRVCQEADGCPTEMAVLKRFWREHQTPSPQTRAVGPKDLRQPE